MAKQPMTLEDFREIQELSQNLDQVPEADRAELKAFLAQTMETMDPPIEGEDMLDKVGLGAIEALDYVPGGLRTLGAGAVSEAAHQLAGTSRVVTKQDMIDAAVPFEGRTAPSMLELAKRAGVPEGGHLSDVAPGFAEPGQSQHWYQPEKGGALDVTPRGVGAFGLDVAMSPSSIEGAVKTLRSKSLKAAELAKSAKVLEAEARAMRAARATQTPASRMGRGLLEVAADPLPQSLEFMGKNYYKSAFNEADDLVRKKAPNLRPPSEVSWEQNMFSGPRTVMRGSAKDLVEQTSTMRNSLAGGIKDATNVAGEKFPLMGSSKRELMRPVRKMLEAQAKVGGRSKAAASAWTQIKKDMKPYTKGEVIPVDQLDELKRSMQFNADQQRAYDITPLKPGRGKNAAKNATDSQLLGRAYQKIAETARRAEESAMDEIETGVGGDLHRKNSQIGSLKVGQPGLEKTAGQNPWERFKSSPVGAIAGGAMGSGVYHMMNGGGSEMLPFMLAAGAGALAGSSSTARTYGGLLMGKGAVPIGNATRARLIETTGDEQRRKPSWSLLKKQLTESMK